MHASSSQQAMRTHKHAEESLSLRNDKLSYGCDVPTMSNSFTASTVHLCSPECSMCQDLRRTLCLVLALTWSSRPLRLWRRFQSDRK